MSTVKSDDEKIFIDVSYLSDDKRQANWRNKLGKNALEAAFRAQRKTLDTP